MREPDRTPRFRLPHSRPPRVVTTARETLAGATRWQRVEIDTLAMLAAGLAVAIPTAVAVGRSFTVEGLVAAIGALMVSSSGHLGRTVDRAVELLISGVVGAVGVTIGALLGEGGVLASMAMVLGGVLAVALGTLRPGGAKASLQVVVTMVIGSTTTPLALDTGSIALSFVLGAVLGGTLRVLAYAASRVALGSPRPEPAAVLPPWSVSFRAWREEMSRPSGWEFPLRLGACMAVAAEFVHLLPGSHSTWVLLTVVIVVQRDRRLALARTAERGLGTCLGVILGALMLLALPGWTIVVIVGVIGAVRGHLKAANYAAYSLVMTPLVLVLTGLGSDDKVALLAERVGDTVLGCLISVVIGLLLWPRVWRVAAD